MTLCICKTCWWLSLGPRCLIGFREPWSSQWHELRRLCLCLKTFLQTHSMVTASGLVESTLPSPHTCWKGRGQTRMRSHQNSVEGHVPALHRLRKRHRRWGMKARAPRVSVLVGSGFVLVRCLEACKDWLKLIIYYYIYKNISI